MRSKIHLELEENTAWYLGKSNPKPDTTPAGKIFVTSSLNSSPNSISYENSRHLYPAFTEEEYDELLSAAVLTYADQAEWSPFEHCQMISNILKRPLCLFTSLADLNSGEAFTFLPLRHQPEECYKYPISIAWQQRGENNSLR